MERKGEIENQEAVPSREFNADAMNICANLPVQIVVTPTKVELRRRVGVVCKDMFPR